jgi:hypothetical protein
MTTFSEKLIVAIDQVKFFDNTERSEVVVLTNIVLERDVLVVLDYDRYRFGDTDRVTKLNLAPLELINVEQLARQVSSHVRSGAVNLRGVFSGEGAAANSAIAAVLVAYDFSTGKTAVSGGTAERPGAGRVDDKLGEFCISEEFSDQLGNLSSDILQGSHVLVANGNENGFY